MKIQRVKISNVLGIEDLEIKPGSVTLIEGANATGKTSVLEALRTAFGTAHDATLLRSGAEKGEVVLVLDDGTEINKQITADKSSLTVKHPQYGKISKPATYLQKLADILSLNPIAFLTAKSADRVDTLLQAIPMEVSVDQLRFVPTLALEGIDISGHALPVLAKVGKAVYDLRTGVNRAEKEKRATAKQMSETLPAEAPEGDWREALQVATDALHALTAETADTVSTLKGEAAKNIEAAKDSHAKTLSSIRKWADREIEAIRERATGQERAAAEQRDAAIAAYTAERDSKLATMQAEYEPKRAELNTRIGEARAMVEAHTKAEATREFIAQLEADCTKLVDQSQYLSKSLEKLDALKLSLLEKLPVEGLEIRDGEIYVGGIPFERVNESKRIRLAIEVARLRARDLGIVAVDGLERLDPKAFAAFTREAAKSQLQFIVAHVTDDEALTVRTNGEAVTA